MTDKIESYGKLKKITLNATVLAERATVSVKNLRKYLKNLKEDKLIYDFDWNRRSQTIVIFIPLNLEILLFSELNGETND